MQAIYQWQMTGNDIAQMVQDFVSANDMSVVDQPYFEELLTGVINRVADIDPILERHMTRTVQAVDPIERAIIRMACYELLKRLDVPYRVVLNEAVNLSKKFCADNSHAFINGVLDKVAHDLRSVETASA